MPNRRKYSLLSSSRMPADRLPEHIEASDGKSGRMLSTARISENVRIHTDEKGWDFLKRLNQG